jgi:hypothetical protein
MLAHYSSETHQLIILCFEWLSIGTESRVTSMDWFVTSVGGWLYCKGDCSCLRSPFGPNFKGRTKMRTLGKRTDVTTSVVMFVDLSFLICDCCWFMFVMDLFLAWNNWFNSKILHMTIELIFKVQVKHLNVFDGWTPLKSTRMVTHLFIGNTVIDTTVFWMTDECWHYSGSCWYSLSMKILNWFSAGGNELEGTPWTWKMLTWFYGDTVRYCPLEC